MIYKCIGAGEFIVLDVGPIKHNHNIAVNLSGRPDFDQ